MIAYFDTSALVPLVIDEPGTARAALVWDSAERVVSVRLAQVEARAALARAARLGRITARQLEAAKRSLNDLLLQLDLIDIDDSLTHDAANLAELGALGTYDAVHLAAATRLGAAETVLVAGDQALLNAALASSLSVVNLS